MNLILIFFLIFVVLDKTQNQICCVSLVAMKETLSLLQLKEKSTLKHFKYSYLAMCLAFLSSFCCLVVHFSYFQRSYKGV